MGKSCKFCGESGLNWNFNILYKKWELLESGGNRHKCMFVSKSIDKKTDIKNDPKINAALRKFKQQLEKDGKKEYILRPARNYQKPS